MAVALVAVSICRFVRNVVLARMLLPADFGVGATFSLTLTFLELITELGPAKQLVQSREGARPAWRAAAHTVLVARGAVIALAIFMCAGPISSWLGVPEAINAFRCLALAPLMRGFEHLDCCRLQRGLRMLPLSLVEAVPAIAGLIAAPIAAYWLGDYRAFLVVTLISAGGRVVISHLVARKPYRVVASRDVLSRFVSFGWPLVGNSLLLFLILHGERVLVASWFDLATLGAYSVALALAFTPAMMLARLHGSVALPLLSRSKKDPVEFRATVASSSQVMCLAGGLIAIAFVLAGSWLIGVCYSEKYLLAQQVVPWIGLLCAVRVARATPAMMSIALGDTKIPLYSNLARAVSFGVAALLLSRGADVVWAPICGFAGELFAYLASLALLKARQGAPVEESLRCFVGASVVVACLAGLARFGGGPEAASPVAALLGGLAMFAYAIASGPRLRRLCRGLLHRTSGRASHA